MGINLAKMVITYIETMQREGRGDARIRQGEGRRDAKTRPSEFAGGSQQTVSKLRSCKITVCFVLEGVGK